MNWRSSRASDLLKSLRFKHGQDPVNVIGALQRVAIMADTEGDMATAVEARNTIVRKASKAGADFELIAAFAWLLQHARRASEHIDTYEVMWVYKWAVEHIHTIASIPVSTVEAVIDELEREYAERGLHRSSAVLLRLRANMVMRRRDATAKLYAEWSQDETGAGSDCDACRRHARVKYLTFAKHHERALVEAGPILDGTMTCDEVPRLTFSHVVECALRLGRIDDARRNRDRGVEALGNRSASEGLGVFLSCDAVTGRLDEGLELLAKWLRRVLARREDTTRFEFFRGAVELLGAARRAGMQSTYLMLPPTFDAFEPDGTYEIALLEAWFDAHAEGLAQRFDHRHGNSEYMRELEAARA